MVQTNKLISKINNLLRHGVLSKFQADNVGAIRQRLVSFLELRKSGRTNSAYPNGGVIETLTGETLTIRVGDHHANEANFRAKYNVSIIVGDGVVVTETIKSNVFCEYVYDSECFNNLNKEESLTEIFQGLLSVLKTGHYVSGRMGKCAVRIAQDADEDGELGAIDRNELQKSIIDAVTSCVLKWEKPWKPYNETVLFKVNGKITSGFVNAYSLKRYNAQNIAILSNSLDLLNNMEGDSFAPIFLSRNMADKNMWHLKKKMFATGENGETLTSWFVTRERYWRLLNEKNEKDAFRISLCKEMLNSPEGLKFPYKEKDGKFFFYSVRMGHVTPAENIVENPFVIERVKAKEAEMTEYVENIIKAYSGNVAPVSFDQSDKCFYRRSVDEIHLVPPQAFENINEFYSTRFHETVHSTLHPSRLNRSFPQQDGFGSVGYAMEELVAEMGAWIMCAEFGISFCPKDKTSARDNSTAYVGSWLTKAKKLYDGDEEKTIIEAYKHACKAVDYILKGVNFDDMIPESVKQLEDETLSDIEMYADSSLRVVNVRRDSRIRFFFSEPPSEEVRAELKGEGLHYSGIFKAWQIANTDEGVETAKRVLTNVLGKTLSDDDEELQLAIAKARAVQIWLSLQKEMQENESILK